MIGNSRCSPSHLAKPPEKQRIQFNSNDNLLLFMKLHPKPNLSQLLLIDMKSQSNLTKISAD